MKNQIIAILLFASSLACAEESVILEIQKEISESVSVSISQEGRLSATNVKGDISLKYDLAGRPTSIGDVRIAYDLAGRPTSIGDARIKYDLAGRPTSVAGEMPTGYGIRMRFASHD